MVYCTISWVHNIGRRWCEKELLSYKTGLKETESSMKKLLLSVGIALLLVGLISSGSAVVILPSDQFLVGNETYTVNATMVFDLSVFPVGRQYLIKRNGVNYATSTASGSGVISFSNTVWVSPQRFEVFLQTQTSGDTTPAQISGMTRTTSDPLDTSPTYVWVNVCGDFSASHDYTVPSGVIDSSTHFVGACQALFMEK
jgi:hypothetical protein